MNGSEESEDTNRGFTTAEKIADNSRFNDLLNSVAKEHERLTSMLVSDNRQLRNALSQLRGQKARQGSKEMREQKAQHGSNEKFAPANLPNEIPIRPPEAEPTSMPVLEDLTCSGFGMSSSSATLASGDRDEILSAVPCLASVHSSPSVLSGSKSGLLQPGRRSLESVAFSSEFTEAGEFSNEAAVELEKSPSKGPLGKSFTGLSEDRRGLSEDRRAHGSRASNSSSAFWPVGSIGSIPRSEKSFKSMISVEAATARFGSRNRKLDKLLPNRNKMISIEPDIEPARHSSVKSAPEDGLYELLACWKHRPLNIQRSLTLGSKHVAAPMTHSSSCDSGQNSVEVKVINSIDSPKSVRSEKVVPLTKSPSSTSVMFRSRESVRSFMVTASEALFQGSRTVSFTSNRRGCISIMMLLANGRHIMVWDVLGLIMIFWDTIWLPLQVFDAPETGFVTFMMFFTLIYWTCDMGLSFFRVYFHDGVAVAQLKRTALRYVKTWFIVDFVLVSTDWIIIIMRSFGNDNNMEVSRVFRVLRVLRTLRLARILKCMRVLDEFHDRLNSEVTAIVFNLIGLVFMLLVANHFIACLWFLLGTSDTGASSWVQEGGFLDASFDYQYSTAMHWSLTQFTPASMDVQPCTTAERVFTIVIIVMALICFSSFLSSITSSMTKIRGMKEDDRNQFWLLRKYLQDNKVSQQLGARIIRYLDYACSNQRSHVQEGQIKLLELLSEQLHSELRSATSVPHMAVHPLLAEMHALSDVSMHRVAAKALGRVCLANGDALFYQGELATLMFFVCDGELQYVQDELPEWVVVHDWMCEPALWTSWVHVGEMMAMTETEVLSLDSSQFSRAVALNPAVWSFVNKYAVEFVKALNVAPPSKLSDTKSLNETVNPQDILQMINADKPKSMHRVETGGMIEQAITALRTFVSIGTSPSAKSSCVQRD